MTDVRHTMWAITVSPSPSQRPLLKAIANTLVKMNRVVKLFLVMEKGSAGTHPHFHAVYEFTNAVQKSTVSGNFKNAFKHIDVIVKKPFYCQRQCYDFTAYIGNYLLKEDGYKILKCKGFDLEKIKQEAPARASYKVPFKHRLTLDNYQYFIEEFVKRYNYTNHSLEKILKFDDMGVIICVLRAMQRTKKFDCRYLLRDVRKIDAEISIMHTFNTSDEEDPNGINNRYYRLHYQMQ